MSGTGLAPSLQVVAPEATTLVVLFVLLSGGLLGMSIRNMFESIMADEDESGGDGLGGDDVDGGLITDEGNDEMDDDLGGLGGLEDDDLGGFGEDEELGEMEGGGGGNVDELEHRLDELENEVGSLSSTVNTVRNENEQISEGVDEVEENVRKLLDIYEMVTRGVNPFADDIDAGMGGMDAGDGSFGLFDDEDEDEEDIDEDIAEADAEGFFDDDLVEEDSGMPAGGDAGDVLGGEEPQGEGDAFQDSFDEGFGEGTDDLEGMDELASDDDSTDESGGTSFDELKDEYESGEADWADDEFDDPDEAFDDPDEAFDDPDEAFDDPDEETSAETDEFADDELFDEVIEGDDESEGDDGETATEEAGEAEAAATETAAEPEAEATQEPEVEAEDVAAEPAVDAATEQATGAAEPDTEPTGESAPGGAGAADEGKPYLTAMPEGFASDLIVIEWLEFLVEEAGVRETARAIDYYESINWVNESVAADLREYLDGFDGTASDSLTIDHHAQSLKYISQLDGGSAGTVGGYGLGQGGGLDGIQR